MQHPKSKNHKRQEILLDLEGKILESDNQLFDIQNVPNLSAIESFPLVASMFDSFIHLEMGEPPVTVPSVAPNDEFLTGFFDFSFSKIVITNQFYIKWIIEDCTDKYITLKDEMQIRNESIIKTERDRQNKQK